MKIRSTYHTNRIKFSDSAATPNSTNIYQRIPPSLLSFAFVHYISMHSIYSSSHPSFLYAEQLHYISFHSRKYISFLFHSGYPEATNNDSNNNNDNNSRTSQRKQIKNKSPNLAPFSQNCIPLRFTPGASFPRLRPCHLHVRQCCTRVSVQRLQSRLKLHTSWPCEYARARDAYGRSLAISARVHQALPPDDARHDPGPIGRVLRGRGQLRGYQRGAATNDLSIKELGLFTIHGTVRHDDFLRR